MADRAYGQQHEMEHPSMAGTLAAQAEMIWPLERPILERIGLPEARDVLDAGTGTGELAGRLARTWPKLGVTGLDLFEGHLQRAREAHPRGQVPNLAFVRGDVRKMPWPEESFGAVLIRHLLHAFPEPERILAEARRVLRPGGLLYVLAEDYGALFLDTPTRESRDLFLDSAPGMLGQGTDLLQGRTVPRRLAASGFEEVHVDTIVVDTENASRDTFARMLRHWRDGYAGHLAEALGIPKPDVVRRFDGQILSLLDSDRYAAWLLFAVSARKPSGHGG